MSLLLKDCYVEKDQFIKSPMQESMIYRKCERSYRRWSDNFAYDIRAFWSLGALLLFDENVQANKFFNWIKTYQPIFIFKKKPKGHVAHLRKQFKSINTYD